MNIPAVVNDLLPQRLKVQKNPTMTVVAAALVDGERRVLLQQRGPGRSMAGLWEFPGGKVEEGELPEPALVRELKEELGIDVEAANLAPAAFASAFVGDRHMLLLLYVCRVWDGAPEPLDAAALQWTRPDRMSALPMPPADEPLIGLLDAFL